MNYFIQGSAANAERIKAAFEAKAIHNGCNLNFTKEDRLFYSCDGKVNYCSNSGGLANIIKTHPDYQELELPVEPKFKVGDEIKTGNTIETIAEVYHATRRYYCESGRIINFVNQDLWHLVPKPHYDISNFKPFDNVLVRVGDKSPWRADFFEEYDHNFYCFRDAWEQCIPFNEETKHLLGTTDMCDEQYINW